MCLRPSALSRVALLALCIAHGWNCGHGEEARFSSPATTFKTYREALARGNLEEAWTCFSSRYQRQLHGGDFSAWAAQWRQDPQLKKDVLRREIAAERLINPRIAYLLFDSTTLSSSQESPFFYFVHEEGGWKITAAMDSIFHRELEGAIARGDFRLPDRY